MVTLHTPLTADTHHLLDRRRIEQLKPGAYVVNTGRGALIDTEALVSALEGGRLGGAALDVLEGEEGIFYADCRNSPSRATCCCDCRRCRTCSSARTPPTTPTTRCATRRELHHQLPDFESRNQHG